VLIAVGAKAEKKKVLRIPAAFRIAPCVENIAQSPARIALIDDENTQAALLCRDTTAATEDCWR
jgi:hypothetical protein